MKLSPDASFALVTDRAVNDWEINMLRLLLGCLAAVLVVASDASAFTVTINAGGNASSLQSYAYDGDTYTFVPETLYPGALPYIDDHTLVAGPTSSSAAYDLQNNAFEITMNHERGTAPESDATSKGTVFFQVDTDVDYVLEGTYTTIDPNVESIRQLASLYDVTAGSYLFRGEQETLGRFNESFTVGEEGGNYFNMLEGSTSGTLLTGHVYQFDYRASIWTYVTAYNAATASGYFKLAFVPEPSVVLLLGSGLVLFAMARRD